MPLAPPAPPVPPELLVGRQTPTHELRCSFDRSLGRFAVGIAKSCGIDLDPWQVYLLEQTMGRRADGLWASFENAIVISRQNGKSEVLVARALAGLFLLGENEITWSAHRYDTAMDGMRRVERAIKANPELLAEVELTVRGEVCSSSHGSESIQLKKTEKRPDGAIIKFKTRTTGGGRGLAGDLVIVDESQDATEDHLAALRPTLGARPNPQIYYTGSAGGPKSTIQADLVHRALNTKPDDPVRERLYYGGWSADEDDDPADERTWAKTNPGLGIRLLVETMRGFYNSWIYRPDKFAREHLGVGDYPRPESETWIVPAEPWSRGEDPESKTVGPVLLCVDAKPDLSKASISLAGYRADRRVHIQTVAHENGTRWTPARTAELLQDLEGLTTQVEDDRGQMRQMPTIVMDAKSPLAFLVTDFEALGIHVRLLDFAECADATSWFLSQANPPPTLTVKDGEEIETPAEPSIVHLDQPLLTVALASANLRTVGDRMLIARHAGAVDMSPLTSAVHAGHGLALLDSPPPPPPALPRKASQDSARREPPRRHPPRRSNFNPQNVDF